MINKICTHCSNAFTPTSASIAYCSPNCAISARVIIHPTTACWEWTGFRDTRDYGTVRWQGSVHYVHRLSYQSFNGAIPDNHLVRHKCDNPKCCNPNHLELGNQMDNAMDKMKRSGKISETVVRDIRSSSDSLRVLGIKHSLNPNTVMNIRLKRTYAWVI